MITKEDIINQLRHVHYPGFTRDIVSFGVIRDAIFENGRVEIVLSFTTEAPDKRGQIQEGIRKALSSLPEVKEINFKVVDIPQGSPRDRAMLERKEIPGVRNVIAVASGKGGVGKSTVAVNLACALKMLGRKVGLLDADIYGPSIPIMMGLYDRPGLAEDQKFIPPQKFGLAMMSLGFFIEGDSPVIWRGPMVTGAIRQLLYDSQWGGLDDLVVDLPPGTGDAQLTLVQLAPLKGAVIVTTPQDVALVDARKGVSMFQRLEVKIFGIVENMSYFICPHCQHETDILSRGGGKREAERLSVPFLGEIPMDSSICSGGDGGVPIVIQSPESEVSRAFLHLAQSVVGQLS